jgi:hypothetical protein
MIGEILGPEELAAQRAELLPARETLCITINVAPVVGVNLSFAINAATIDSIAASAAEQDLSSVIG